MTCYFRHMKDVFTEIGIEATKENRKDIDRKIHGLLGVEYKNCVRVNMDHFSSIWFHNRYIDYR